MWWPKLESKVKKILETNNVSNTSVRNDRELLEEILAISRLTAKRTSDSNKTTSKLKYNIELFEKLVANFVDGTEVVFELDWEHTKSCLDGEWLRHFISPNGDFLNPSVEDEGNNWANRVGFLESYRKLKSFMENYELRKLHSFFDNNEDLPF